jgi:predicted ATP-binding protein involved in virulence
MRITKVELKDFRCFDDFQISFSTDYPVHVVIAENMVGKSALMAALRMTANTYTSGLKSEKQFELTDHRIIGHNPISDISPSLELTATALILEETGKERLSTWKKYKTKPKGERTKVEIIEGPDPRQISKTVNKLVSERKAVQPLLSFIGTEYIHTESSDTVEWDVNGKSIDGYKVCFDDKSIKKYLFRWLGRMDGIVGEMSRKPLIAETYQNIPTDAIAVFEDAVKSILPDIKEIVWSSDLKEPVVKLASNEIRPFKVLSDGYRYLILLAGELATRSFILNKHLGCEVLKKVHGLVLIDEFGIHLHPALQNDALDRLQKTFPRVQFIVSTHSPLLLNGLKKEQVHILSSDSNGNRIVSHPEEDVIGLGADEILTRIFGLATTMDTEFLKMNDEFTKLYAKKAKQSLSEEQEKRFAELSKTLSNFRLDPELKLLEQDPITALVRKKLNEKAMMSITSDNKMGNNVVKQVEDILGELFNTKSSK